MKKWIKYAIAASMLASLAGCSKRDLTQGPDPDTIELGPALNVIAGSELKDAEVVLRGCAQASGYRAIITYTGSLDAVDRVMDASSGFDVAWLSHGKYLQMSPAGSRVIASNKVMYSRVVLGVKPAVMKKFGWASGKTTWKDIYEKVAAGEFRYAMTNPAASNTGFVTLVGLSASLSGKGDALEVSDIPQKELATFFSGAVMTSGSTGLLMTRFLESYKEPIDAVIAYDASIKSVPADTPLEILIPKEGVVTADYPIMLLNKERKTIYDNIVACLRTSESQKQLAQTGRTPLAGDAGDTVINELPFPGQVAVMDALLSQYLNKYVHPSLSYLLIDNSGSMEDDDRIGKLKSALIALAEGDGSVTGRYSKFKDRETIYIAPFTGEVFEPSVFQMTADAEANKKVLTAIRQRVLAMRANGNTAIFDAAWDAQQRLAKAPRSKDQPVSVLLFTDGVNKTGMNLEEYKQKLVENPAIRVPVFPIVYGEANMGELTELAKVSGGVVFDARTVPLTQILKQIRMYQ